MITEKRKVALLREYKKLQDRQEKISEMFYRDAKNYPCFQEGTIENLGHSFHWNYCKVCNPLNRDSQND